MSIIREKNNGNEILRINEHTQLEIPGCILYSRGGLVPHLTSDNLETVTVSGDVYQIPLETIYEQPGMDIMKQFGKSFHEFSASKGKIFILNPNDSYLERSTIYKYNEEKSISIWAPGGRRKITSDEFMNIMDTFKFDVCIPPSDTIPEGESKKRCRKSFERTVRFLDQCLQIKKQKKLNIPVLGVIEGGDSSYEREKCAKEVKERPVDGYVLSGFDRITNQQKELLQLCMSNLEDTKGKFAFGIFTPSEVLDAVELGIDVFDSVIAYYAAERGCALDFPFTNEHKDHLEVKVINDQENLHNATVEREGEKEEKKKEEIKRKDISLYEMVLSERRYHDDIRPLVIGCSCYCCKRYTRAYLHHLLITKEMLARVLLMMHNLTHWLAFFKKIRDSKLKGCLNELKTIVKNSR